MAAWDIEAWTCVATCTGCCSKWTEQGPWEILQHVAGRVVQGFCMPASKQEVWRCSRRWAQALGHVGASHLVSVLVVLGSVTCRARRGCQRVKVLSDGGRAARRARAVKATLVSGAAG